MPGALWRENDAMVSCHTSLLGNTDQSAANYWRAVDFVCLEHHSSNCASGGLLI